MTFRKFSWVGNRITPESMKALYAIKLATKKPITQQVAEAVQRHIKANNDKLKIIKSQ